MKGKNLLIGTIATVLTLGSAFGNGLESKVYSQNNVTPKAKQEQQQKAKDMSLLQAIRDVEKSRKGDKIDQKQIMQYLQDIESSGKLGKVGKEIVRAANDMLTKKGLSKSYMNYKSFTNKENVLSIGRKWNDPNHPRIKWGDTKKYEIETIEGGSPGVNYYVYEKVNPLLELVKGKDYFKHGQMSQKEWNHPDEAKRLNSHKFYGDIVKIHQPDKYSLRISYQKDQERFDLKHLGDNWLHGGRLDPVHVLCIDLTPQGYTVYEETFERGINATRADIYDGGKNPKETEVKKSTFKDISNKALDEI